MAAYANVHEAGGRSYGSKSRGLWEMKWMRSAGSSKTFRKKSRDSAGGNLSGTMKEQKSKEESNQSEPRKHAVSTSQLTEKKKLQRVDMTAAEEEEEEEDRHRKRKSTSSWRRCFN